MKQSRLVFLAALVLLLPLRALAQQIQIESVSGHDAAAREALFKLQPWAPNLSQVIQPYDAETVQPIGRSGLVRLKSSSLSASDLLTALSLDPRVASAEPNYIIQASDTVPNDPDFGNLWAMQNTGQTIKGQAGVPFADIGAVRAWDIARGSDSVVVGVVDTGVDYTHPDLAANIWTAQSAYQITLGDTTYTCPPGSHGFNAEMLTCDPMDDNTHGTHVSGTIGAQGNNLLGVTGVNWRTSIAAFKFLNLYGLGSVADAVNAIEAAIQLKSQGVNIRVLSNSWGVGSYSDALLQAVNDANTNDLLFVAAAGNYSTSDDGAAPTYPAAFNVPNIIAVAATDNQDNLAYFSNYGPTTVHLGAPGVNILSTFLSPNYGYLSGTSMATPHVSGAAALLLSKCTLTTAEVKTAILNSVDPIASLAGKTVTGGRLNVFSALNYCGATPSPDFTMLAAPAVLSIAPGGSASTQISVEDFDGFSGAVTLSASGVPPGVTASFSNTSISGAGSVTLTLTTSATTVPGTYPITVLGSSGGLSYTVVVDLIVNPPDYTLSAAPASLTVIAGSSTTTMVSAAALNGFSGVVTLTASGVTGGVTASFTPNSLSGSGASTLTFAAAANATPGVYPIAITGVSGALSHTAMVSLTVNASPDFTFAASPVSVSAIAGNSAGSTLTISALNAFNGVVGLTASGLPAGVTASLAPASVTGSGTSVVTLTTANSTTAGVYSIAIQAVSGNLIHTATVSLTVLVPDFTFTASPAAIVLPPGGSATSSITVGSWNGFTGSINLSTSALPAGVTGSFSPPVLNNGSGVSALTLVASAGAPAGFFTVTVQGASGNLLHTTPLAVTLQPSFLLPPNVSLLPGSSIPYPVSLPAPAPSSLYVTLTSSDTSTVTVTPANVLIPAGSTTPSLTPKLIGVAFGQAAITVSAWNYAPATQTVLVADSLSFLPNNLTLSPGASQNLTLILAAPAATAMTVNLTSSNPAVATLPATATFPANATSVTVRVTGIAGGSAVIHASALPAVPDTASTITVGSGLAILTTTLANGTVNSAYSQTLSATGGTPPLTWILTSGALPTGLMLSLAGQISGTPAASVTNLPLTFKVTDAGSPPQTASTTLTITIAPAGPSPASITPAKGTPQSATVNTAFAIPLTALVKNSEGNPVSGVTVSFSAPSTGTAPSSGPTGSFATGFSATAVTDATGSASVSFTANAVAGSYTVNASAPGIASPALFLLTNLAGPAARISATSGSGQSTGINTTFSSPLATTVTDASGNPVSGVVVKFLAPVTGASGSFAAGTNTVATGASGLATSPALTANGTPGSYAVTASVSGVTASASFSLTNIGPAASVIAIGGSGQSTSINTPFTNPLVVKVQDAIGNPVPGVTVAFAAPGTGASGAFNGSSMVTTNASGIAAAPAFTANSIGGSYNVSATVLGVTNPAMFTVTNLSGIVLPAGVTVAPGLSAPYPIALGAPAPAGGVFIALTSSSASTVALTLTNVFVPAGSTTPTVIPRVHGINLGSAAITASAWNYPAVSQQVQVADGLNFFPSSVIIGAGNSQNVTLTLSAPVSTNLTVSFSSSNPAAVAVPSTVMLPANTTSLDVRLTGLTPGTATITAGSGPNAIPASIIVTVR
ncbi:MAG TPA: S8 family serine peptidase [Bryobacteraceae bacterium]|nr:S8 family serine peptidase [Bryobacteraceae bacterium]